MIKYRLTCNDCEATFDSWFPSSAEYERLKKKNFINCHICNSLRVEKTLMSPNVLKQKNDSKIYNQIKKFKKTRQVILKYQEFIKKISIMWERILPMKQELFIIIIKNLLKVFMVRQQKRILKN